MGKLHSIKLADGAESVQSVLDNLQPGDRVVFAPGVYRMALRVTAKGTREAPIVIEAEQHGTVIITGADEVADWKQDGADWVSDIDLSHLEPSRKHGLLAGRREQVFVDGQPLRQVLHRDQLAGGRFFYDESAKRLYIRPQVFAGEVRGGELEVEKGSIQGGGTATIDRTDPLHSWPFLIREFDPAEHLVEVTTRARVFDLVCERARPFAGAEYIVLRGLHFRASGDAPQQPMVSIGGTGHLVEDCRFEHGAARGFDLRANGATVRRCVARLNGQMGFSGYGDDNLVEDCLLQHNNTKHSGFVCFEQGGCKIVKTNRFTMRRVRAIGNDGPGIWYDIDNAEALIEQCWCEGNTGPGIMYEISWTAVIRNNVCWKNGYQPHKDVTWDSRENSVGVEDPIYGQGILIQMSRDCEVYNNTCVGNRRVGIEIRHHPYQQAGNPSHSTERYKLVRNSVFNNLLADNGWCNFDETIPPLNPRKNDEVADNHYDYNLYHNSSSLLQHGGDLLAYARWGKTLGYGVMSLEEWRASRDQDAHSIQWDPGFTAPDQGDFTLEPWSPAKGRGRPVDGLETDYAGNPRAANPTIGAFE
ncbi:MAG: right-handed parallel beta-helix repeat-containing protein [Oceanipulchritudo sp.]